jgi:hypothetical protein
VLGTGLLAGCARGDGEESTAEPTPTETTTTTDTGTSTTDTDTPTTDTDTPTRTGTAPADESYSVTMDPVGTVEFGSVPAEWMGWSTDYCDMGIALGQHDGFVGMLRTDHWTGLDGEGGARWLVDSIQGVEFDPSDLAQFVQGGEFDAEVLIEIDPDVIVGQDGILRYSTREAFRETLVSTLENDPVTSQATAVRDGAVDIGGTYYLGSIVNLFRTELLAKQLYPEEFGEYRGPFEVPDGEELFDRQRVADICNGNL